MTNHAEPFAFSIDEFCKLHSISRFKIYDLWKRGAGPRKMRVGSRTLISREAAAEWRRAREEDQAVPA